MKLSPQWMRDFVDLAVDNRQLADDLTSAGIAVEGASGEGDNLAREMEITTNRPDAMNHYGVAREASAIYDLPLKPIEPTIPNSEGKAPFAIEIQDKEGCARYTARIIRGVKIAPSPQNVVQRLATVDQRSINNIADASNYTLWEMGHPTHAFDLDLLQGSKIIIRRAKPGETLKTLDGVDRKLAPEDLVIADAHRPVALAGVMGGFDTMITERTTNVLIESAWFDPAIVRKTAKRHGLHTDASHRFERGADYGATSLACARVAQRILESAGGTLQGAEIDAVARTLDLAPIQLDRVEIKRILGGELNDTEVLRILRRLGFVVIPDQQSDFLVTVPSWRLDVEREIDLIEELARIYGYNKFANTLPAFSRAVTEHPDVPKDAKLRATLLALGYNETVSLSFISHHDAETFSIAPVLELANPLSEEASIMRTSMVPGMLDMLAYNLNRGAASVRLFEAGSVFENAGKISHEPKRVCFAATGSVVLGGAHQPARAITFFDMKGDVENLLHLFQQRTLYFDSNVPDYYHPGRAARAVLDGQTVAHFGQLHPNVAAERKLRQEVLLAELYLDRLYKHPLREIHYESLPKYPGVERDFSFIFDDAVIFERIQQAIEGLKLAELRSFSPAEIFRGGNVPAGKYSILLRATFQSNDRTLREEEVAQWHAQIIQALEGVGGSLRA